jgi:hypothetical protein
MWPDVVARGTAGGADQPVGLPAERAQARRLGLRHARAGRVSGPRLRRRRGVAGADATVAGARLGGDRAMARHRRAAYAEKARLALLRDVLDLDGFDWNRMVAPAALDLALHGEAFDGQTACSRAWPACRRSAATSTSPRQRRRTTSASAGARRSSGWPPFSADELAADTPRGTCASSGDVDLGRPGRGGASRTPVGGDPPPIGRWGPWSPDLGAANLRASPNDGLPTEVLPCPTCPRLSTPSTF